MTAIRNACSTRLSSSVLPTEFRLFKRGLNDTSKGQFLFDARAAASVMAEYRKQGVDLMIDLEHESLADTPARADSRDARGWFKLELRNGELWAVGVTWASDGARRLKERRQRYISPAFLTEPASEGVSRITEVINVALVAMPATHGAPPLAASRFGAQSSKVIGVRLTNMQAAQVNMAAAEHKISVSELARRALSYWTLAEGSAGQRDAERALDALLRAVGLDPDHAFLDEALDAIRAVVERSLKPAPAPADDAMAEAPDPEPEETLTAHERELAAKMTPEQRARFAVLRAQREREREQVKRARGASAARNRSKGIAGY